MTPNTKTMITKTEVRIGSWVRFPFHNENVKIIGLPRHNEKDRLQVFTRGNELIIDYENIKPIPLTEEILIRAGFNGVSNAYWRLGNLELAHITTDESYQIEYRLPFSDWHLIEIKHLHQLQNLVQALTGEELQIDLNDLHNKPSMPKH